MQELVFYPRWLWQRDMAVCLPPLGQKKMSRILLRLRSGVSGLGELVVDERMRNRHYTNQSKAGYDVALVVYIQAQ